MRWKEGRRSTNVEDRRGSRTIRTGGAIGGGTALVIAAIVLLSGGSPEDVISVIEGAGAGSSQVTTSGPRSPEEEEQADFVSAVLASTEDAWTEIFAEAGRTYEPPRLVLFTEMVDSACGSTSSAVGPFYCPPDRSAYLDLVFFQELHERFGAPGDFARAYVIAHEIGHHVQNVVGTSDAVQREMSSSPRDEANALSVRLELQADCYAGVWAARANRRAQLLEPGDVEEGLGAAAAIGDDRLQRDAGRRVNPETFTHGSSADRVTWFRRGFESGDVNTCDTFGGQR